MRYKFTLLITVLLLTIQLIKAQTSSVQIGTQFPLMYAVGYEYQFKNDISFNFQAGVLTKPYDEIILNVLESYSDNKALMSTIGEAFKYGLIIQPTLKYNFSKNYIGLYYSYFWLYAEDTPMEAFENYYGVSLPIGIRQDEMKLRSELLNIGLMYGRRFYFKNPSFQIWLELSLAKTCWSYTELTHEDYNFESLSNSVDEELNEYYMKYGYLPSLNIYFIKSF